MYVRAEAKMACGVLVFARACFELKEKDTKAVPLAFSKL